MNDRMMPIRLAVGGLNFDTVHKGLDDKFKKWFWEDSDEVVRGIPHIKKTFTGGDFSGHIGSTLRGYDDVHGGFYFGDRNEGVIAQRLLTLSFIT